MGKKTIRTGIVGAGFAATFHYNCLQKVHGTVVEVVGVFAADAEQAAEYAKERGIKAYDDLDSLIDDLTRQGNRALKLEALDRSQLPDEVAHLRDTTEQLNSFLARHLTDEEDLVVPIILHHKLRG